MEMQPIDHIVDRYGAKSSSLLAIMQDIQDELNYLPREALEKVATRLDVPLTRVYRLASFFSALSLEPRGKYICQVCMGTACHVRGAGKLLDHITRGLKVEPGQTSQDGLFTIESVNCVGACALGPVVVVNNDYHGKMTSTKVTRMLKRYRGRATSEKG